MKYKNTKTGAIINSSCNISGGDWIKFDEIKKEKSEKVKETPKEPAKKEEVVEEKETEDTKGVTKKQIIQELDAMGIDYDPKMKKDELYNLMIKG